jgi:hypothetical protein
MTTPASRLTLIRLFEIVDRGGRRGITLAGIATAYLDGPRRSLSGLGSWLSTLASAGLLLRHGSGRWSRWTLSESGRRFLDGYDINDAATWR